MTFGMAPLLAFLFSHLADFGIDEFFHTSIMLETFRQMRKGPTHPLAWLKY